MAHQTEGGGFGTAYPVNFSPEIKDPVAHHDRPDEHEDLTPSDTQPPGVDEDEPQSLEEALAS